MKSSAFRVVCFLFFIGLTFGGSQEQDQNCEKQTDNNCNQSPIVPNANCVLTVPPHPLTAQGLATPYILSGLNAAVDGPCNQNNPGQSSFVQGAIFDLDTSELFVYNPLVIDQGTVPAIPTVIPHLPHRYITGIWFGSNADTLTLVGTHNSLNEGRCINGLDGSVFGQFAYCNAIEFFEAVNGRHSNVFIPPLGIANDGLRCPTIRDFVVVDADPSDNLLTTYLLLPNGQTAQDTERNRNRLFAAGKPFKVLVNGSDNRVLLMIDEAFGCRLFNVTDLADPHGLKINALPLNELQAAARQLPPSALIPAGDPMIKVNNVPNLNKLNLFRLGVNQPTINSLNDASTTTFCLNLFNIQPRRLFNNRRALSNLATPDPATGNTFFTFLAARFIETFGADGLACNVLIGKPSPITCILNADGVCVDAILNFDGNKDGNY